MRHRCQSLAAAAALHLLLICDALQPFVHQTRTNWRAVDHTCRRAATEDDLWADTGGDDLDLAGLDDVDALDRYKRRCAACAQLCVERDMAPSKVCVSVASEAAAMGTTMGSATP